MSSYAKYAKYYDLSQPDPRDKVRLIDSWIRRYNPKSKSILEIGCGTGSILKLIKKSYSLSGLDLSKEMLAIAKKKVPNATFYHSDMTNFNLNRRFDVILCIFDALNHVPSFNGWEKSSGILQGISTQAAFSSLM